MKNYKSLALIVLLFLLSSCAEKANSEATCSVGYVGDSCSTCADGYRKESKYCIYDCKNVLNVDKVNDTNDGCICKDGYEFDKIGKTCNKIVNCLKDSDCALGFICQLRNDQKVCLEGCRTDRDCKDEYNCTLQLNKCELKIEENFITTPSLCAKNEICNADTKQCVPKIRCLSNDECSNGEVCNADGYCDIDTGCNSDQYCINKNANKPACSMNSGMCYECTTNEHCTNLAKPICNTMTHVCGTEEGPTGECQADSDCGMNKRCNTEVNPHECIDMVTSCHFDTDCQNNMHCNISNGRCVMCLNDTQCTAPKKCNTNTSMCEEASGGVCSTTDGMVNCLLMGGEL